MQLITRLLLLWACFNIVTVATNAQDWDAPGAPLELKIEEIGVEQGLSQGMIHGMHMDLKGYLWIATKDGLNRYDGNHFQVFRHDPQDPNSIASNYTRSLHVEDRGLIWVGTNSHGLDLYDPAQSKFIHFGSSLNPSSASRIKSVPHIYSAPSGEVMIWDAEGKQCEVFYPPLRENLLAVGNWNIRSLKEAYQLPPELATTIQPQVIGYGSDNELYIRYQRKIFALKAGQTKLISPDERDIDLPMPHIGNAAQIQYFLDSRRQLYCISMISGKLYKLDKSTSSFHVLMTLPDDFPKTITRIFIDHRERVWVNSATTPLYRLDPVNGVGKQIDFRRFHFAGTGPVDIYITCEDQHHNIFAGTSGNGFIKITSRNDQFTRRFALESKSLFRRVAKDGHSFCLDELLSYQDHLDLEKRLDANGFKLSASFALDAGGMMWAMVYHLNTEKAFLLKVNPSDLSYSLYPAGICQRPVDETFITIMIDHHGNKWITAECVDGVQQLMRIDTGGILETYKFPLEVIRSEHSFVTDWLVDQENNFWLGSKQGLFFYNTSTNTFKHYNVENDRSDALYNNHILSICPDPANPTAYLWIGTDGGGLNKMDIHAGKFSHYTTDHGLPNNVVYAVQGDTHHNLWLSTNRGLSRFDTKTSEVWTFTVEDGLPGNEFNRTEYARDSKGRLYFGGVEGAVRFDPEDFYKNSPSTPVVINRLKLSNKTILYKAILQDTSDSDYQLPAPIENLQKLTFPYTERMITLGFSLLDFTNPYGNKYRYKLEGFNKEWIDAGGLNEAVFTNLNTGTYTFLVAGRNSNNTWSDPAKLQLVIRPAWWNTWWFRTLVVLLIGILIYGLYRYRLQQAFKLQHLRNRIAADLHDEIGSTLSSISLAGTVIQHKLKDKHPEVDDLLHKINHNTQTMMEAMSDIVWAVNTKNDRFDQVVHRMRAYAVEILEPAEIMVHFDVSTSVSQLQLDMQQRKNMYLIFKEVIHNAAKYAQCENVWVILSYSHGKLKMEVRDDGAGFEVDPVLRAVAAHQNMGGNGIPNMHQRAQELKGKLDIQSAPGTGTKVTLVFSV